LRSVLGAVLVMTLGIALGAARPSGAATAKSSRSSAPSLSSQVAQQKKKIEEQQRGIDEQRSLLYEQQAASDSQAKIVTAQATRLAALDSQLVEMKKRLEILESQSNLPAWDDKLEERIRKVEAATQKSPELPPDVVSAGDFPGSIRIPGSDAAIKFGARVRTAVVFTLDPLGTDDRFLTNSIPVGVSSSGEARRTNVSARASRLNMEFRTPGGKEEVRAFFEGDFAGAEGNVNAFRLRHAYAQYRGFIVGQTWSTFSDPWVELEDLDFEGVSSENVIRQPQLRYWWTEGKKRIALALENPAVSITGASGVNLFPDIIGRVFLEQGVGAHLQIAGVVRQIRGQTTTGDVRTEWGAGGSVSGVVIVKTTKLNDRILFQVNGGSGVARYINDLQSAGGMDGVFDTTTTELKTLPVLGWYAGYQHRWKEWSYLQTMNLRSTILWSWVGVHNYDFMPADSYKKTNRVAVNLVFSPSGRVDAGLEYIYGSRENLDGQHASANQIQAVGLFRF
jgi:hypothetical protein